MRVLISGITGHLGRELSAQLCFADVQVHGLTRQQELSTEWGLLHHLDGRTETVVQIVGDVKPDIVVHLAGLFRSEHDSTDIVPLVEANIEFGNQLLEAMRCNGCSRIITAGSYLQHADDGSPRAFNLYAATKQAFDGLVEYYTEAFGFTAVRLTLGNVYSEDRKARRSIMTDIVAAWTRRCALVLRNPDARLDLIHVEDAARAFVQVAGILGGPDAPAGRLSSFSVTSGSDVSAMELAGLFGRQGGRNLMVEVDEQGRSTRRPKPWRGPVLPGWAPRISLENGIHRILETLGHSESARTEACENYESSDSSRRLRYTNK